MNWLTSASALIVAAVLLWSAIAKMRSPGQTRRSVAELGLPAPIATILPFVELLVAVMLLASRGWGGVFAFALLAAFTTTLILILRSGQAISCGCFGGSDDAPVRWLDVARNLVLLVLSAIAAANQ